jgi:hypothetical protein
MKDRPDVHPGYVEAYERESIGVGDIAVNKIKWKKAGRN